MGSKACSCTGHEYWIPKLLAALLQELSQMKHTDVTRAGAVQAGADLHNAARIGRDHGGRAGLENVLDLAALQLFGHRRFGEVVTPGAAAADGGFGQLNEMFSGNRLDQRARLRGNALRVG